MSENVCPGCGEYKYANVLCCDRCWKRIPTDLPNQKRWRSNLRSCRQIRAWGHVVQILEEAKDWLATHPKRAS